MTRIDATYRVVTPMFCGGAEPKQTAELRLPSFKGVLRFWWRALSWRRLGGNLKAIHQEEACLFGSADGGQSRVVMRLKPENRPKQISAGSVLARNGKGTPGKVVVGLGARYLGYGVMEPLGRDAGKLTRPCIEAPFQFTVQMRCRGLDKREQESLEAALIAVGTMGGMGTKSRKGFGSLVLQCIRIEDMITWRGPESIGAIQREIEALYGKSWETSLGQSFPEITALSERAWHVLLSGRSDNPLDLLDRVGQAIKERRKTRLGDAAFGLPRGQMKPDKYDRRASPLFIHIHVCDGKPVAVVSFLPAKFLPSGTRIGHYTVSQQSEDELYRPIHEFLNRLARRDDHRGLARQKPFTEVKEVRLP